VAALTMTTPTAAGVAWTPAAVSASDTISDAQLGTGGCFLIIVNGGGSPDTVTVQDASLTPSGNAATNLTNSVANGTTEDHVHSGPDEEHVVRRDDGHAFLHDVRDLRSAAGVRAMSGHIWMQHGEHGGRAQLPDIPYWRARGWEPTDGPPPEPDLTRIRCPTPGRSTRRRPNRPPRPRNPRGLLLSSP
jgi:hypothetical protein